MFIDDQYLPNYLHIRAVGEVTGGLVRMLIETGVPIIDNVVGKGEVFCPVIYDITEADSSSLTVNEIRQIIPGVIRRVDRIIIVDDWPDEKRMGERVIRRFTKTLIPGLAFAESHHEALKQLGIPPA